MSKMTTNFDDWETDPDFVRDMDEMDQRWGNKRTVGSINMSELIDEVRRDHKTMRDKNQHSSQRDYSSGFSRGDLTGSPTSASGPAGYESQEHMSRRVITKSSESSYIRETTANGQVKDAAKKSIVEKSTDIQRSHRAVPPLAPKPSSLTASRRLTPEPLVTGAGRPSQPPPPPSPSSAAIRTERVDTKWDNSSMPYDRYVRTEPPRQFQESSVSKRIFEEEQRQAVGGNNTNNNNSSNSPRRNPAGTSSQSQALKSIQDKIDAFKREFEEIESKVARKSEAARSSSKKTLATSTATTTGSAEKGSKDSVQYVTCQSSDRLNSALSSAGYQPRPNTTSPSPLSKSPLGGSARPTSTSPQQPASAARGDTRDPKASIKSLSERFESMGRETSDDFRRRMEERRREFFDKIKTQVRETRKGLDGFDMIDSEDEDEHEAPASARKNAPPTTSASSPKYSAASPTSPLGIRQDAAKPSGAQSPFSRPSSRFSEGSQMSPSGSLGKPKVYTQRETTQEQIVSRFVKENDRVVHDETKRNVERSSSRHGSSGEEEEDNGHELDQPSSIKFIDRELRSRSPLEAAQRTRSPIDEIKRKIPQVEPSNKGAGLMARTLYDYQAVERDELTFDVDDLITNIEKIDQGWYKGTITKGDRKQVGLFPANYVKLLNDSDEY